MKRLLLLLSALLCFAVTAHATCSGSGWSWNCTAGSTPGQIQTVYNSATTPAGATITLANGAYNWGGSAVTFDTTDGKAITFICQSVGGCTITGWNQGQAAFYSENLTGTINGPIRISGFVFDNGGLKVNIGGIIFDNFDQNPGTAATVHNLRIDHNTFQNAAGGSQWILIGDNKNYFNVDGVIDHNTWTGPDMSAAVVWIGGSLPAAPAAPFIGTANNLFFEDNTITYTALTSSSALGCTDAWGGARYVIRHNSATNCLWATHGATHDGGPYNVEFYNNTTTLTAGAVGSGNENCERCFHHQGSGTITTFNNTFQQAPGQGKGNAISVVDYRGYVGPPVSIDGGAPTCDGTVVVNFADGYTDGNRSPTATYQGYPCWHQPGRIVGTANTLFPMYSWNNTWADATISNLTFETGISGGTTYENNHVQANRDYYNAVSTSAQTTATSPFNGTTGMGFGTLARRPTTCTTGPEAADAGHGGVGYFATDQGPQGVLYGCTATNTWATIYTPYTYPHPLVQPTTAGPLRASTNSNYFTDGSGKAVFLTGTHTFTSFQDLSMVSPPPADDFNALVTMLQQHGHNTTILWRKDLPTACNWGAAGGGTTWFDAVWPWTRTGGAPNASDGLPRFDFNSFDNTYFTRLRARALQLQNAGIYAVIQLFDGLQLSSNRCAGDGYPFTGSNNINGIDDGYPGAGLFGSMNMGAPNAITNVQDAYVRKVIDTLNDLTNVIWEISEESDTSTQWWQGHMIGLIHTYEMGKPLQHPVDFPTIAFGATSILYNSNADQVSPNVKVFPTPPGQNGCGTGTPTCKVTVNDSDHSYFGMWNDTAQVNRNYLWENFMAGNQMIFMDPWIIYWPTQNRNLCVSPSNGVCTGPDTRWDNFRDNMGYSLSYANRMNLITMTPKANGSGGSRTTWALAHAVATSGEWLVYAPSGGSFTVDLSATTHSLAVEWLNPSTGVTTSATNVTGGSSVQSFTPPFGGGVDAVLYLLDQTSSSNAFSASAANTTAVIGENGARHVANTRVKNFN